MHGGKKNKLGFGLVNSEPTDQAVTKSNLNSSTLFFSKSPGERRSRSRLLTVSLSLSLLLFLSQRKLPRLPPHVLHARPLLRGVLLHLHPAAEQNLEGDEGHERGLQQGTASDLSSPGPGGTNGVFLGGVFVLVWFFFLESAVSSPSKVSRRSTATHLGRNIRRGVSD